jgi:hypothetical protein
MLGSAGLSVFGNHGHQSANVRPGNRLGRTSRMSARRHAVLAALEGLTFAGISVAGDWKPPEVALSRQAYEAQYPMQTVTAAALEIEQLAATLGIDAAPDARPEVRPEAAVVSASASAISASSEYVSSQLQDANDAVGRPPMIVAEFLDQHAAALANVFAAASGSREIAWDLDVSLGTKSPVPSWSGLTALQKVIAAQVLLDLYRSDSAAALEGIEAIWQVARSLAARPELLSQLMAMVQARLAVGLLRKVRAPAYGWEMRLREGEFHQGFLAAFQNDAWPSADAPGRAGDAETVARIYRRFADGLVERSPCAWTTTDLQHSWDVAISGDTDPNEIDLTNSSGSIIRMLLRSYRLLFDSELTALILDARAERAASREDAWPLRLPDLESHVCPGHFFVYARRGGMTLAFEGSAPGTGEATLTLPSTFRGAPPPTPTPTPTKLHTVLTPTPPAHRLLGR